jgi:4-amino-4-deoxy-L-arabinose transferase-like glycosyltransferase
MYVEDTAMASTEITPETGDPSISPQVAPALPWHRFAISAILLLSAFLDFFHFEQNGYSNPYYAAAVKSMMLNWHNFFFVSFDPGGFVTVDKPPLGLWIQVASAKLLGFSGFSLLLPEAVAGVLSVALLFHLVQRTFGHGAGLAAALALALTPISVVTSRNSTVDTLLVLTVLMAAWAVLLAAETGRLRWLLLCALIVGLGFNMKMLEAYLVVPAFGLVYLLGAPLKWRMRILHLALAALLLAVISLSWVAAVDLTPAAQRPYVGSSGTNAELNLAFGYNGLERITGLLRGGQNLPSREVQNTASASSEALVQNGAFGPDETGNPGPLRLLNEQLGGQVSWLLPLALLGLLAAAWQSRPWIPLDRRYQSLVLWGIWLLTMGIFFSIANFFHTYYLVMLAPAICALVGIGVVALWQDYLRTDWRGQRGWLLPITLVVTAAVQWNLLSAFPDWSARLTPFVLGLCLLAAVVLVFARVSAHPRISFVTVTVVLIGMLALLISPVVWASVALAQGTSATLPKAGPSQLYGGVTRFSGTDGGDSANQEVKLEQYLLANEGNTRFLVATINATSAAPIILHTGKAVMALGGFLGSDPILTTQQVANLVKNNTIRFFLLPAPLREIITDQRGSPGGPGQNSAITSWVSTHCTVVPQNLWQSASSKQGSPSGFDDGPGQGPPANFGAGRGMPEQLYDCAAFH